MERKELLLVTLEKIEDCLIMPLKGKQYKLDVDGDKKITRKDFQILSKNAKKSKKKNGKAN